MRRGTITMGTLLSVFLATSDEMLPILLSAQVPLPTVGAILGLKFLAGAAVGFAVDAVLRLQHHQREPDIHGFCQQEHCSCEGGIFRFCPAAYGENCDFDFCCDPSLNLAFLWLPHQKLQVVWNIPVLGEVVAAFLGLFSQLRGFGSADKPVRPGDYGTGPYAVGGSWSMPVWVCWFCSG